MIRTAILSFWHVHAIGYVGQARNHPDMDVVAAWDEDHKRGRKRATQLDLPFVDDLDELLGRPDIDAVILEAPTSLHHDIAIRAAKAGKHIFSDKVLAPTIKEAKEIVAAADAANVTLVVGMPHLYYDFTVRLKEIVDSGDLGALVNARLMNCHGMAIEDKLPAGFYSAKEACGGALMDMCHIVYLLPHLLGHMPTSTFARFGYFTKWCIRQVSDRIGHRVVEVRDAQALESTRSNRRRTREDRAAGPFPDGGGSDGRAGADHRTRERGQAGGGDRRGVGL